MEVIEGFYNEFNNIFEKIEDSKRELKRRDVEYRNMREEYYKIMDKYPNLQLMFEDDVQFQLNKDECNALCSFDILISSKAGNFFLDFLS